MCSFTTDVNKSIDAMLKTESSEDENKFYIRIKGKKYQLVADRVTVNNGCLNFMFGNKYMFLLRYWDIPRVDKVEEPDVEFLIGNLTIQLTDVFVVRYPISDEYTSFILNGERGIISTPMVYNS